MTEKKTADEYFKEFLDTADPVVKEQFPEYKDVLKVAKTLSTVKFRTRYNCFIDDCEHPDPISVVEPGRAESLDHLVQRLTGKPNPTARDLSYLAIKQGSDEFEDPTKLSEDELDERLERAVALGDRISAEQALADAVTDLSNAQVEAGAKQSAKQATQERVTSDANATAETVPGVSGQARQTQATEQRLQGTVGTG